MNAWAYQTNHLSVGASTAVFGAVGVLCAIQAVNAAKTGQGWKRVAVIAGAGGAAHLPGMAAALTPLPVLAVPVRSRALNGIDSLLSIVQMPGGVPVGTLAIGTAGARNAALLAAQMLATERPELHQRLTARREAIATSVGEEVLI